MRAVVLALLSLVLAGACASPSPQPGAAGPSGGAAAGAGASAPAAPAASAPGSAAGGGPTTAPAPVTVRYGIAATSLNFLPARMAVEQGFYRKYGLEVEILQLPAGSMAAAQISGEVEYTTAYPNAIRLAANGAPLRVVSTLVGAPLFVMLGRPEVNGIGDLRGRTLGITTRGGAQDKTTRDIVTRLGMNPETDVTILPAGAQTPLLVDALATGRVQVAALSAPWHIRARDMGMKVLASAPDIYREPQNGLVVTEDRLARHRDQVRNMIQAEIESIRFMRQNRAATVALSSDWLSITEAEADESYDFVMGAFVPDCAVDVAGIETFLAAEKAEGHIPADTRIEQVAELKVAAEAAQAMGATR
jgi:ABC-type nitrate/sulfonate/bicarbonate transport system substrate-binding protein